MYCTSTGCHLGKVANFYGSCKVNYDQKVKHIIVSFIVLSAIWYVENEYMVVHRLLLWLIASARS